MMKAARRSATCPSHARHLTRGAEMSKRSYPMMRVPRGHPIDRGDGWGYVHRFVAYEAGLLTDLSLVVHHENGDINDNRVENLEAIPKSEHDRLHVGGRWGAAVERAKTHCPAGHPYQGENLYVSPRGDRQCRVCRRAVRLAFYERWRR